MDMKELEASLLNYVANSKVKFECSGCGNEFNQKWANFFIYNVITSIKYKFALPLLEEDGRNWWVAARKSFNTWYYKIPVYTVEVVISIRGWEVGEGEGWLNDFISDSVS